MKSSIKSREPNIGDTVVKNISLAEIRIDKTQSRAQIDEDTVEEYAELMDDGVELPHPDVFSDGQCYWLGDGFHRYFAAQKRGLESIACEVHQGTFRDALKYSLNANVAHGLRRTNEDKRRAVEIALADDEWQTWSNVMVANLCGVSDWLVADLRETRDKQVRETRTSEEPPCVKRLGRDGKLQPAKKVGRRAIKGGVSFGPLKLEAASAANGRQPIKNGTVVSEKDKRIARDLLVELCTALETLGLYDQHSYFLEQMTADVESLEFCDTKVHL